jgi:hypothetical protein
MRMMHILYPISPKVVVALPSALGMSAIRLGASTRPPSSSPDDVSILSIGDLIEEEFAE